MFETALQVLLWSGVTLGLYAVAKRVHRRWPSRWLLPIAVTPLLVGVVIVALHASYTEYLGGTRWLVLMIGPGTVASAVPLYEQRALVRAHWPVLMVGMIVGSVTALLSSWGLAVLVGLDETLQRSLMPRSMTTPFAMAMSGEIGGVPALTAVFVVLTGILGAIIGDVLLARLPLRSSVARGALLGVGAHGIGTARAHQIGRNEGAIAGLIMVLVGLMNVIAAPLVLTALGGT
jgi:predicted murein hydrolase (TIGR00659 family)